MLQVERVTTNSKLNNFSEFSMVSDRDDIVIILLIFDSLLTCFFCHFVVLMAESLINFVISKGRMKNNEHRRNTEKKKKRKNFKLKIRYWCVLSFSCQLPELERPRRTFLER